MQHPSGKNIYENLPSQDTGDPPPPPNPPPDVDPPSMPSNPKSDLSYADAAAKAQPHIINTHKIQKNEKNTKVQKNVMPQHISKMLNELTTKVASSELKFKVFNTSSQEVTPDTTNDAFFDYRKNELSYLDKPFYHYFIQDGYVYLKQIESQVIEMAQNSFWDQPEDLQINEEQFMQDFPFELETKVVNQITSHTFGTDATFKLNLLEVGENSTLVALCINYHPLHIPDVETLLKTYFLQTEDQILAGNFIDPFTLNRAQHSSSNYPNGKNQITTWVLVKLGTDSTPPTKIDGLSDFQVYIGNRISFCNYCKSTTHSRRQCQHAPACRKCLERGHPTLKCHATPHMLSRANAIKENARNLRYDQDFPILGQFEYTETEFQQPPPKLSRGVFLSKNKRRRQSSPEAPTSQPSSEAAPQPAAQAPTATPTQPPSESIPQAAGNATAPTSAQQGILNPTKVFQDQVPLKSTFSFLPNKEDRNLALGMQNPSGNENSSPFQQQVTPAAPVNEAVGVSPNNFSPNEHPQYDLESDMDAEPLTTSQ